MKNWIKAAPRNRKVVWWAAEFLFLAVIAVIIWVLAGSSAMSYLFSDEAQEGKLALEEAQKVADTDNFNFQINARPVFEDGASEGSLMITNPTVNGYNMQVIILLDGSEQEIYVSDILTPGKRVGYDKLSAELEKGVYSATAFFDILDLETNESVGQVSAALELTVNN